MEFGSNFSFFFFKQIFGCDSWTFDRNAFAVCDANVVRKIPNATAEMLHVTVGHYKRVS